ncbi:ABC transporter ATP-binding protein [Selenomonas caprae]|uniref:ABC-type quaternary amine transporter n=1 Tax=Selenomonas caprae TaxID=2606905 RepID=A0A5D6WPK4_9FIRM|nr:ABC transporter ATP-binding protein [Selenomonas caprae]TYZ29760.1 ABC transporter ATP-binding protein [Selenomonas caprae]
MSIDITNVTRTYHLPDKNVHAIRHVDLHIASHEFVCLLGPSGCGKSTLLKILSGLERPDEGTLEIDGTKVNGPGRERAVVFQDYALLPWRTVRENVAFPLELAHVSRKDREEKAQEYLKLVHLEKFADAYIHQLSGGMRQRVAIARALVQQPDILLMDEPFGALDAFTRMELQSELVKIWQAKRPTIVFVTHDIDEAIFLGDKVVIMTPNPGKVHSIVEIPVGKPRHRTGPDFNFYRDKVYKEFSLVNEYAVEYYI